MTGRNLPLTLLCMCAAGKRSRQELKIIRNGHDNINHKRFFLDRLVGRKDIISIVTDRDLFLRRVGSTKPNLSGFTFPNVPHCIGHDAN